MSGSPDDYPGVRALKAMAARKRVNPIDIDATRRGDGFRPDRQPDDPGAEPTGQKLDPYEPDADTVQRWMDWIVYAGIAVAGLAGGWLARGWWL